MNLDGRLIIDNRDVWQYYGAYVEEGGWNDLIAFAPLKTPTTNDWHEENGVEADLTSPKLDVHNVSVKFVCKADKYADFISWITAPGQTTAYIKFNIVSIGRTYQLRYLSCSSVTYYGEFVKFTMKFADDSPKGISGYQSPTSSLPTDTRWKIDGTPLTDYGCRVLQGTLAELLKKSDVKQNLVRNNKTLNGATYANSGTRFKTKDAKIKLLMTASSLTELWRNYDALIYDLRRGGWHSLYCGLTDKSYTFYYKSCQVSKFFPTDKIWLEFTITLTINNN